MKFDTFYSSKKYYFSEEHSGGMATCLEQFNVKPCSVIDIGAGEGRNSLYLSSKGYDVTAIEPSLVGSEKIINSSNELGYKINVFNSDFLSVANDFSNIGLIVAVTSLEHMDCNYMQLAIVKIKEILQIGGYFYSIVFTEDDPGYKKDPVNSSECSWFIKHYFKKNELKELFSDFEILHYDEYTKIDTTHGPKHYHGKAKLFARKL